MWIWLIIGLWTLADAKPFQSDSSPTQFKGEKNEEVEKILFGDRGVLTGIFKMMDQQRRIEQPSPQNDVASSDSGKIGKFDFKKIVDTLVMGSGKGELGDPGVELPEVLGICNRLSCGDIYKAIDKFRKSEMFSNFQTALTLVNDPNGWETIGKLLSNPELIAQFTSGSGMEELFGSALGEAKKESNATRTKNSSILPEDGDFGIDFSEDEEGQTATKGDNLPEFAFNKDGKPTSEDYYGEVAKNVDESEEEIEDHVDVDVSPPAPLTKDGDGEKLPPVSFSIDGAGGDEEDEMEVISTDQLPPKKFHAGAVVSRPVVKPVTSTTSAKATTMTLVTTPTTTTTAAAVRTTTAKNYRKESDYYAMYYDDTEKSVG